MSAGWLVQELLWFKIFDPSGNSEFFFPSFPCLFRSPDSCRHHAEWRTEPLSLYGAEAPAWCTLYPAAGSKRAKGRAEISDLLLFRIGILSGGSHVTQSFVCLLYISPRLAAAEGSEPRFLREKEEESSEEEEDELTPEEQGSI